MRVMPKGYQSLGDLGIVTDHADLVVGAVENPDPSDPTVSLPADDPTTDWEHSEILPAPRPPISAATPRTIGVTGYGRCSSAT